MITWLVDERFFPARGRKLGWQLNLDKADRTPTELVQAMSALDVDAEGPFVQLAVYANRIYLAVGGGDALAASARARLGSGYGGSSRQDHTFFGVIAFAIALSLLLRGQRMAYRLFASFSTCADQKGTRLAVRSSTNLRNSRLFIPSCTSSSASPP